MYLFLNCFLNMSQVFPSQKGLKSKWSNWWQTQSRMFFKFFILIWSSWLCQVESKVRQFNFGSSPSRVHITWLKFTTLQCSIVLLTLVLLDCIWYPWIQYNTQTHTSTHTLSKHGISGLHSRFFHSKCVSTTHIPTPGVMPSVWAVTVNCPLSHLIGYLSLDCILIPFQ